MPVETVDRARLELDAETERVRGEIDEMFGRLLVSRGDGRDDLYAAMRHAAIGGGKRLRPLLTVAASRLFGIARDRALRVGGAIEHLADHGGEADLLRALARFAIERNH